MIKKYKANYILYCLLILLPIYQDSPLNKYFGSAGYSLLPSLSVIGIALSMVISGKIVISKRLKVLWLLGLWLCIISIISITIWVFSGKPTVYYDEIIYLKSFKVILQFISYLAYTNILLKQLHNFSINEIFFPIVSGLFILTLICIVELIQIPYAFEFLHFNANFPYSKVRLLTMESSWTVLLICNYFSLSLFYSLTTKRNKLSFYIIMCEMLLIISSGSKSLIIIVAFSILLYLGFTIKHLSIKGIVKVAVILVLGILFVFIEWPRLREMIIGDIENYTSITTRLYTIFIGFIIGVVYPFGIGTGLYLSIFPSYLAKYIHFFDYLPIKLNTTEIIRFINSNNDSGMSVKSDIFQYNMYWGILGTVLLLRLFFGIGIELNRNEIRNKNIIIISFIVNIIIIMFSLSFAFEFWLLLSIVVYMNEKPKEFNSIV
jgi:hypothetical protein